jgi:hypothetical protein
MRMLARISSWSGMGMGWIGVREQETSRSRKAMTKMIERAERWKIMAKARAMGRARASKAA